MDGRITNQAGETAPGIQLRQSSKRFVTITLLLLIGDKAQMLQDVPMPIYAILIFGFLAALADTLLAVRWALHDWYLAPIRKQKLAKSNGNKTKGKRKS